MWIFVIIIGLQLILVLLILWYSLVVFLTWKSFDAFDRDSALTWQNSRQSEQGRNLPHCLRNPWISKWKIIWLRNELFWNVQFYHIKAFIEMYWWLPEILSMIYGLTEGWQHLRQPLKKPPHRHLFQVWCWDHRRNSLTRHLNPTSKLRQHPNLG